MMRARQYFFQVFCLFFILSFCLFLFFHIAAGSAIEGFFQQGLLPFQRLTYQTVLQLPFGEQSDVVKKLQQENIQLQNELKDQRELKKENQALQSQFAITTLPTRQLLPASIVGIQSETFVIDKGLKDNVKQGNPVVYKDVLIGQVSRVSSHMAVVARTNNKTFLLTGYTSKTNALGVVKGMKDSVLFDKVLLSDRLDVGDLVVTKGDTTDEGKGVPPGLLVGKIVGVHKQASSLFQSAEMKALLEVERLSMVFVVFQ